MTIPLLERFPALADIPRVALGDFPTPLQHVGALSAGLWIKRDDRCADPLGGNKTRALEFLLGGVRRGDTIVTVGSAGSTHALAVATYAGQLGATVLVGRWRQEMNAAAELVSQRIARTATRAPVFRSPVAAYAWATWQRWRGATWIAAGGSTPLGILGHVNAGLELIAQIDGGEMPVPSDVVVPLGTGGTAAGLLLAFAIARRPIRVVGARVVPRVVARRGRVIGLANATKQLIEQKAGQLLPAIDSRRLEVEHDTFGGAYGRETPTGAAAAAQLSQAAHIALDATYSAKAFGAALRHVRQPGHGPTLFWLTFDQRALENPS